MPRQKDKRVRASEVAAIAGENAHAREEFLFGKVEALGDPGRLKWRKVKGTNGESPLETRDPFAAQSAIAVVKDPRSGPVPGIVSKFSNF
jgi:hypothetical protein